MDEEKINISKENPEEYATVLARTTLYKKLYGCDILSNKLNFLRKVENNSSDEIKKWLDRVYECAKSIQKKALDFGDLEKLSEDLKKLEETEKFLACQSDVLPCQIYSPRDLALKLRSSGKI